MARAKDVSAPLPFLYPIRMTAALNIVTETALQNLVRRPQVKPAASMERRPKVMAVEEQELSVRQNRHVLQAQVTIVLFMIPATEIVVLTVPLKLVIHAVVALDVLLVILEIPVPDILTHLVLQERRVLPVLLAERQNIKSAAIPVQQIPAPVTA